MADLNNIQNISVGTQANDGTGDTLRDAFIKVNANFVLLRTYLEEQAAATGLSTLSSDSFENLIRNRRNKLLYELDHIVMNPLRWASFTEEYKNQLRTYRQQLLDVPQQPGFPSDCVWPTKPTEN